MGSEHSMLGKDQKRSARSASALQPLKHRLQGAGIAALVAVPALVLASHGTVVESALASALADPASILAARSPGSRAPGALTQTKRRYAKSGVKATGKPTERVLGQVRTRPDAPVATGTAVDALAGTPVEVPQTAFGNAVAAASDVVPSGVAVVAGAPAFGIGFATVGGGGGSGGGTGGTGGTGGNGGGGGTPPVSAVPEPSTWLMTILGFMGMGIGLRRRRTATSARRVEA